MIHYFLLFHLYLLPRCYQDGTNQPHQAPCPKHLAVRFLVGLDCLRLGYRKFVRRRSHSNWVQSVLHSLLVPRWCQNTMTHHDPL